MSTVSTNRKKILRILLAAVLIVVAVIVIASVRAIFQAQRMLKASSEWSTQLEMAKSAGIAVDLDEAKDVPGPSPDKNGAIQLRQSREAWAEAHAATQPGRVQNVLDGVALPSDTVEVIAAFDKTLKLATQAAQQPVIHVDRTWAKPEEFDFSLLEHVPEVVVLFGRRAQNLAARGDVSQAVNDLTVARELIEKSTAEPIAVVARRRLDLTGLWLAACAQTVAAQPQSASAIGKLATKVPSVDLKKLAQTDASVMVQLSERLVDMKPLPDPFKNLPLSNPIFLQASQTEVLRAANELMVAVGDGTTSEQTLERLKEYESKWGSKTDLESSIAKLSFPQEVAVLTASRLVEERSKLLGAACVVQTGGKPTSLVKSRKTVDGFVVWLPGSDGEDSGGDYDPEVFSSSDHVLVLSKGKARFAGQ